MSQLNNIINHYKSLELSKILECSGVYGVLFNSKHLYIGTTSKSYQSRVVSHIQECKQGTHHNLEFQELWNKYSSRNKVQLLFIHPITDKLGEKEAVTYKNFPYILESLYLSGFPFLDLVNQQINCGKYKKDIHRFIKAKSSNYLFYRYQLCYLYKLIYSNSEKSNSLLFSFKDALVEKLNSTTLKENYSIKTISIDNSF